MTFLKRAALGILLNGLALFILVKVVPEITYGGGVKFFLIGGLFFGVVNYLVKPLIKLLSLPIVILTGGLFLVVINAAILWAFAFFISAIQFRDVVLVFPNLGSYVVGAIVFGIINWGLHLFIKNK